MKNLKKLVSVIVTVAMLISSFAALSVSAAYPDVDESNSYAKAIEVLSGLGIVKGDDEGNFNPTNDIKRSEMVALICRMKGEEGIATSTAQEFDDVPANHWAAGYISWGVASEIIKGYGDGNFGPDASVTLQDAVVMIVRAAGWERIANRSDYGGYPTGHMRIANARGVMDGISYTATKAATREVIAQAIYNGLTMPLVEYISFGENADDDRYAIYDGRATGYELATLLTNTNRIYKVKATIDATAKDTLSLKTEGGDKVDMTIIGHYDYTDMHADLATAVVPFVGETKAADYLGYIVEAYLVKKGADWTLLAVVPDDTTVTETIDASEVDITAFTGTQFKYLASESTSKETIIDVASTHTIYYNGVALTATEITTNFTNEATLLKTHADKITFMGPKNADYNKIFVTKYQFAQVEEVKAEEGFIDLVTGYIELDADDRNNPDFVYNLYDEDGKAIELADIEEDSILNIVAPLDGGLVDADFDTVNYMDIYVTNKVVTGSVDEEYTANKFKIAGEVLKIHSNAGTLNVGDEGVFYITINGLVYDKEAASVVEKNYAFVVAQDKDTAFGQASYEIQLFTKEGELVTLPVASSLKVWANNAGTYGYTTYKTSDGTLVAYMDGTFAGIVADEAFDTDAATSKANAEAKLADRLVTYRLNSNGEIAEIRFAGISGQDFYSATVSGGKYYDDTQVFANYDLNDDSIIFIAPVSQVAGTDTVADTSDDKWNVDKEDLDISAFSALDEDKVGGYAGTAYNFDDDDYLGAFLVNTSITSTMKKAHLAVVKLASTALDAEQNTVAKYTIIQSGEMLELTVDADASVATMYPGDIFRYSLDTDNEIDAIQLIYQADPNRANSVIDAPVFTNDFSGASDYNYAYANLSANDIAIVYGKITEVKSNKMTIDSLGTKLTLNDTEGNTYASIDEAGLLTANPQNAVKTMASAAGLKESYGTQNYYVVAIVGENNRFEDCVMIIK